MQLQDGRGDRRALLHQRALWLAMPFVLEPVGDAATLPASATPRSSSHVCSRTPTTLHSSAGPAHLPPLLSATSGQPAGSPAPAPTVSTTGLVALPSGAVLPPPRARDNTGHVPVG